MVEVHYRDTITGNVTRSLYSSEEDALAQVAADVAANLTRVPFLLHRVICETWGSGYNPLVFNNYDILDQDQYELSKPY